MKKQNFDDIYEIVKLVPKGRVSSYGAIAKYIGISPRIVGWALNGAYISQNIPAHRIVNRNGVLTGKIHFETPNKMQELLEQEGIEVKNDQVVNFKIIFWDPAIELL